MTPKQTAISAIEALHDDATLDEIHLEITRLWTGVLPEKELPSYQNDPSKAPILHVEAWCDWSISEMIEHVLAHKSEELTVACTDHFFDFEDDLDAVQESVENYFQNCSEQISKQLTQVKEFRKRDFPSSEYIEVWTAPNQKDQVYLRFVWDDKEIPMGVFLGVKGVKHHF